MVCMHYLHELIRICPQVTGTWITTRPSVTTTASWKVRYMRARRQQNSLEFAGAANCSGGKENRFFVIAVRVQMSRGAPRRPQYDGRLARRIRAIGMTWRTWRGSLAAGRRRRGRRATRAETRRGGRRQRRAAAATTANGIKTRARTLAMILPRITTAKMRPSLGRR